MSEKKLTDNDWKVLALTILESNGKDGHKIEKQLQSEGYNKALSEVVGIVESWNEQVYDSFDFRKKLVNKLKRKLKRGEG